MNTRRIVIGLSRILEGADTVERQIRLAHRYQNTLISIERARREAITELQRALDKDGVFDEFEAALCDLEEAKRKLRAAKPKRPKELLAELKSARTRYTAAKRRVSEQRRAWKKDPKVQARYAALTEVAYGEIRAARKSSGLYWGTYLRVEQAAAAASRSPTMPHWKSWRHGAGCVSAQIQHGLTWDRAYGGSDRRLRIGMVQEDGRPRSRRHDPARGIGRTTVSLRVGSDDAGEPVWATWQAVLDQEIPPNAHVMWADAVRRVLPGRLGPDRYRDELHLSVRMPRPDWRPRARVQRDRVAAVALDLGWRRVEDDLRIVRWHDSDGSSGELRLGNLVERNLRRCADLRALRDRKREEMLPRLIEARSGREWPEEWPPWLHRKLKTLHLWRSSWRLRDLYNVWTRWLETTGGSQCESYSILDQWWRGTGREHDHGERHLWEYESNLRRKTLLRRREAYRVWSARMARQYETIVIERFDLARVRRKPAEGSTEHERGPSSRQQGQSAAPGELRQCVIQAATQYGARVVDVESAWTTATCAECGSVEKWDQAAELVHTCSSCGTRRDQDETAARNILASWRERSSDAVELVAARSDAETTVASDGRSGRWQRLKRLKQERSQGAR